MVTKKKKKKSKKPKPKTKTKRTTGKTTAQILAKLRTCQFCKKKYQVRLRGRKKGKVICGKCKQKLRGVKV